MKKVRYGYKMTELGEIPNEWKIKKIGELTKVIRGASPRPKGDPRYYGGNIPRLMIADVSRDGKYVIPQIDFLTDEGAKKSRPMKKGDLVISISGTVALPTFLAVDACIHDGFMGFIDIDDSILKEFLYYQILYLRELLISQATDGGVYINLTTDIVKDFNVLVPTIKEQEKIASILSSVDEQINKVNELIQKNKELKKGLMQRLLTKGIGHTKFKNTEIGEVPEEWEVKNLSEVVWYQEGPGLRKWQFTSAGIKVINVTNLVGNYLDLSNTSRYIDESEVEKKYKHFLIDENDIVVASSGNSWGKVSVVRKRDLPLLMNTSVIRFKSMEEERLSTKYLLQFLKSDAFKKQIALLITGSAQPNFGPYHLDRTKIATPNINEQLKIASILSEADEKIKKYENKKQKLEELKKGLMQQLLTGSIRVF